MAQPIICGIKFPFQFHAGQVALSKGEQHIKESIMQIIGTAKGEYLMNSEFGTNIRRRIFDPVNVVALLESDIAEALRRWEPRVELMKISNSSSGQGFALSAYPSLSQLGTVIVNVEYRIRGENEPTTLSLKTG
jgi:phage baseplate assembly protein W